MAPERGGWGTAALHSLSLVLSSGPRHMGTGDAAPGTVTLPR